MENRITLDSGALYDCATKSEIRADYARHYCEIQTGRQLRATLRAGAYAWPGGYPLFFSTSDGAALCFSCARENLREITGAIRARDNSGWRIVGTETNYEDAQLICEHCNKQIPAAYCNDETDEEAEA